MRIQLSRATAVLVVCACLLNAGCWSSSNRQKVTGVVTLKGQHLDEGTIEFRPLSEEPSAENPTTTAGAVISNGSYEIPAEYGLVPGKYKVLITSGDGVTPDDPNQPPGPSGNFVSKDRIPPEYNRQSKLEVEVASGAENNFDFDIP